MPHLPILRWAPTLLVLLAAVPAAAQPPAGRPGHLGLRGTSEKRLRTFEEKVLGPEHAAEHARERRLIRSGVSPASTAAASPFATGPLDEVGRWGEPAPIPVMGIHATMLPTGKVMWWSYPQNPTRPYGDPSFPNTAQAWLWNPATGTSRRVDPPLVEDPDTHQMKPANIWCSGQSMLADGRVLVTGGNLRYQGAGGSFDFAGLDKVFTFNPFNETWTEQPDMAHGRWYPSQVRLPDGRTLIMAGFDESGQGYAATNKDVEVFTPSPDMDGVGTITNLGARGQSGAPPDGNLYPHMFVMPSGKVMVAGPDLNDSWLFTDPGNSMAFQQFLDPSRRRVWGAGVLRPGGVFGSTQVTLIGGSDRDGPAPFGVASSETIDETDLAAGWQPGAAMNIGRSHLNVVLLPDTSMVAVGGGVGSREDQGQWSADPEQRQVELYDPLTDSWSLGAAQAEARAYHSTAVLLPDGRVVSAGDDLNGGTDRDTAEIYEPPYLFKGERPTITSAPNTASYGEPMPVQTPDAITSASLVAPAATTHANDMNQRLIELDVTPAVGGVSLSTPANGRVAPPGWYMLFVVNAQGVPSVARWVLVGDHPPEPGRIEVENRTEPSGAPGQVNFSGGPFGDFRLGDGESVSATVPAGTYPITEADSPGFGMSSVSCDDGSPIDAAKRQALPQVAAGETVRCTFTNEVVSEPPPQTPAAPKPTPSPAPTGTPAPADRRGPRLSVKVTAAELRRGILRGLALDGSGVKRVDVAFARGSGSRCRFWSRRRHTFSRSRRSCRKPVWIRAKRVRRAGGVRWSVKLGGRPPRGRFAVALRAVDGKGNVGARLGRTAPRVRVRR